MNDNSTTRILVVHPILVIFQDLCTSIIVDDVMADLNRLILSSLSEFNTYSLLRFCFPYLHI